MNKKKLSVLYLTCLTYKNLWNPFFELKKKYMGNNIKFYFCTDIIDDEKINYENCDLLVYGTKSNFTINGNYYDRLLFYLENIDSEYIILFVDDMFLINHVNNDLLNNILEIIEKNSNIKVIKLSDHAPNLENGTEIEINNNKFIKANNLLDNYIISLQPTLYEKNFFINLLKYIKLVNTIPHQTGGFEIFGTNYFKENQDIICLKMINPIYKIIYSGGLVVSGYAIPEYVEYLKNNENLQIKICKHGLIFEMSDEEYKCLGERHINMYHEKKHN
jgi:hypothetical protein